MLYKGDYLSENEFFLSNVRTPMAYITQVFHIVGTFEYKEYVLNLVLTRIQSRVCKISVLYANDHILHVKVVCSVKGEKM